MKYLCVCYYDQRKFDAMSSADFEALERECRPRDEALHRTGQLVAVGSLGLPSASKTVRPGPGGPVVSDGPYSETPEPFGAFFIVEAGDAEDAVRVASLHPGAHVGRFLGGGIEVRPCESYEQP